MFYDKSHLVSDMKSNQKIYYCMSKFFNVLLLWVCIRLCSVLLLIMTYFIDWSQWTIYFIIEYHLINSTWFTAEYSHADLLRVLFIIAFRCLGLRAKLSMNLWMKYQHAATNICISYFALFDQYCFYCDYLWIFTMLRFIIGSLFVLIILCCLYIIENSIRQLAKSNSLFQHLLEITIIVMNIVSLIREEETDRKSRHITRLVTHQGNLLVKRIAFENC